MLKSYVSIRTKFSSLKVFARHSHNKKHAHIKHAEILGADTRIRAEFFRRQGLHRQNWQKPSFTSFKDPRSRNVYRKIEDDEEQYEDDGENDSLWSFSDREIKQEQRRTLKELILKKKERQELSKKEPNILTWVAKMQIRYLHAQDPYQWTPEVLADSFPVSKEKIISILKLKQLPNDEADIERHDRKVHQNWLKLKKELQSQKEAIESVDGEYKVDKRIAKMINAAGIPSLPLPSQDDIYMTRKKLSEKLHPKVHGTFSEILSNYKAQFKLEDDDKIGISEKPQKIAFEIGDKEAVRLLSSISSMNINETVTDSNRDDDATERTADFGTKQKSEVEQDPSLSESVKSQEVISSLRQSRRQRRFKETNVTKYNLDDLQMQGTGKIS